jgi:Family of unknown function (DUF5681)
MRGATKGDYEVGYGKPPRGAGFKKGQSGNPRGRPPHSKNLSTMLNDTLNEPVTITEDGRRRKITKREAVIKQLVNKSASADPRSLKILLDLMLNLEARARSSAAPPVAAGPGDEEVLTQLKARLEGAIRDEIAAGEPTVKIDPVDKDQPK